MKTQDKGNMDNTSHKAKRRTLRIVVGVLVVLALIIWGGIYTLTHNYAHDEAKPLEAALIANGAVKQCSGGDPGRGPDNYTPWYYSVFEVSMDRSAAADLVRNAAQRSGLALSDKTDPNPLYDEFYLGTASRKSAHSDLKDGNVNFSVTVYKTRTYNSSTNKQYCTTTKQSSPIPNSTIIQLDVGLPTFKGY